MDFITALRIYLVYQSIIFITVLPRTPSWNKEDLLLRGGMQGGKGRRRRGRQW